MLDTSGLVQLNDIVAVTRVQKIFEFGSRSSSQARDCKENKGFGKHYWLKLIKISIRIGMGFVCKERKIS
jgi:hypothetical protein